MDGDRSWGVDWGVEVSGPRSWILGQWGIARFGSASYMLFNLRWWGLAGRLAGELPVREGADETWDGQGGTTQRNIIHSRDIIIKVGHKIQSTHIHIQQRFDESRRAAHTWHSLINKTLNLDPRTFTWDKVWQSMGHDGGGVSK
jgi:hypothetical protein